MKTPNHLLAIFAASISLFACLSLPDSARALQLSNEFWICNNTNTSGLGTLADPYDGSTAPKFDSIMSNLASYCVMHILAGTYQTAGTAAWNSKSGQKILGSGMNVTTLHLLAGSSDGTHAISTFNATFAPARDTNTEVSDLTIDLAGSTNVYGVTLFGYSHVIRRVRVINSYTTREIFMLQISSEDLPSNASSEGNIIEECEVSQFTGSYCSAIVMGGAGPINSISGVIRNNRVILSNASPSGGTSIYAFNTGSARNLLLEGNYVDTAAVAVEIANNPVTNYIIANNTFKNCDSALSCYGGPLQNITFCFNTVELSSNNYGAGFSTATNTLATNVLIMGNTFKLNDAFGGPENAISVNGVNGFIVVNNSIDSRMTNSIVGCAGLNIYNNVDLFGNAYTNLNQVKPPNGIARRSISGNYVASYADRYIANIAWANCTVTLPPAAGYSGKEYIIADETGNGYTITLTPTSGELINGSSSLSFHGGYASRTIISDGSNWYARKR